MTNSQIIAIEVHVKSDWIDFNGHMNDAIYPKLFGDAVGQIMVKIGLDEIGRRNLDYTLFTVETHVCFLKEVLEGEKIRIYFQLLDFNDKLLHVFLEMRNEQGERLATSEQMLMGIKLSKRRSAPFPEQVLQLIKDKIWSTEEDRPLPVQVGRRIGLRRINTNRRHP